MRRPSHIAFFVSVLAAASALSSGARPRPQAEAPRQLTLVQPGDSQFDALLNQYYPGLANQLAAYQTPVRRYLVLLQNQTAHWARAYSVEWTFQSALGGGAPQQQHRNYIQGESGTEVDRDALAPGQVRLVSMTFDISPSQYRRYSGGFLGMLSNVAGRQIGGGLPVSAAMDAVVYDDGGYTGPDH